MNERIAVCPGSFDPVTVGHLDIIARASRLFDKVIVAVLTNDSKHPAFTIDERMRFIEAAVKEAGLDNVEVDTSDLLLADYMRERGAQAIVKGLRAVTDFEYEFQMALTNKKLNADADTIFLTTSSENMYLSSSLVKMIAAHNGDISDFVPKVIHDEIKQRLYKKG